MTISPLDALKELRRRKVDGVRMFRPLPGMQTEFFRCTSSEILLRGGNRSGKTVSVSTRFAAIARDIDIVAPDGSLIPSRLPHQKGRPLLMWVIGYDLRHIGQTIHRVLLRAGLYKMIPDADSGEWRAFDPVKDRGREKLAKPAPPLIPPTEIVDNGVTWENKGEKQFSTIELKNGTIICAFSSIGEVKAGDPVDVIWIDEQIKYPQHYQEWQARLSDTKGRIFWSSWPATSNMALRNMDKRARAALEHNTNDSISQFVLEFSKNPFIDDEEKAKRLAGWDEEQRLARDRGEFAIDSLKMYGEFSPELHCAYGPFADADDRLAAKLRETGGHPPHDWTRYLILDPGTQHPGVLLAAVPPPDLFGHFVVPYGEVYTPRLDADALAKAILERTQGESFEAFYIDSRAARQTPMGFSGSVASNYSRAFRQLKLQCRQTGSSFSPGSDDVEKRISDVRVLLRLQRDGRPRLRIVTHACPNLVRQMQEYERKVVEGPYGKQILELPAEKQQIDLAQCLEYLASRSPQYVPRAANRPVVESLSMRMYRSLQAREKPKSDTPVNCGPEAAMSNIGA